MGDLFVVGVAEGGSKRARSGRRGSVGRRLEPVGELGRLELAVGLAGLLARQRLAGLLADGRGSMGKVQRLLGGRGLG